MSELASEPMKVFSVTLDSESARLFDAIAAGRGKRARSRTVRELIREDARKRGLLSPANGESTEGRQTHAR